MTASPPSFPPNMHLACISSAINFLCVCNIHPHLCGARSRLARATLGCMLCWRWKIACTPAHQSPDFFPFLLFSAQFIIRELCQSPACGLCLYTRIQPQLHAAVHAHAVSELRKLLLLDLIHSIQVSRLGCESSPSKCQICLAGISHLGSSSIQLLPKLEAGKCTLLDGCGKCPLQCGGSASERGKLEMRGLGGMRWGAKKGLTAV